MNDSLFHIQMQRHRVLLLTSPFILAAISWWGIPWLVPLPVELSNTTTGSTQFLARDNTPLRHLLNADGNRAEQPVDYSQLPLVVVHALLAAEDKRFFSHGGVDLLAITRAAWGNFRSGRVISGASTIHQQLIKNTTPQPKRRTLKVKVAEALQARHLDMTWTPEEVLAAYANRISFGNLMTGISCAASGYFHKPLSDLTPAEAAMLAALPQSPARLNPFRNLAAVQVRQRRILNQMRELGFLNEEDHRVALAQPIVLQRFSGGFAAPHAMDMLKSRVPGSVIRTSLDATLQQQVETIVSQRLEGLKDRHVSHAAAVVLDNASGAVLALVGSRDFFAEKGGQINGAWAPHSPGSALKPFTYVLAFERGATPASIVADLPVEFSTASGVYRPENFSKKTYGPMTYRQALGNSLNISAVKVLDSIGGAETLLPKLRALGLSTLEEAAPHYGLGLTIGNASVRLVELVNAYACLARLGIYKPWTLLADGGDSPSTRVLGEAESWLIADILSDNQAREMAFGNRSVIRMPFKCAVKTGTSSTFRDNWTVGYTPAYTVGVWVGNFDNTPMQEVSGVTGAGPIFRDVMQHLNGKQPQGWYERPKGIIRVRIDPRTGRRLNAQIPPPRVSREEYFVQDQLPALAQTHDYDAQGRAVLSNEYAAWVHSGSNWWGDLVTTTESAKRVPLKITQPVSGTVVILDPDIRNQGSRLLLQCIGASKPKWSCKTLVIKQDAGNVTAILSPGSHEIELKDEDSGASARARVLVRQE